MALANVRPDTCCPIGTPGGSAPRSNWPPGHNVRVDAEAEIVMFSPQREHSHVINHRIEKVKS